MKITHPELVKTLIKNPNVIANELTPDDCALIHDVLGLAGEVGELTDAIKKHVIYRKALNKTNVIEELGDIEFYLEDLRRRVGVTREQCLTANIEKLRKRYEGLVYSDRAAIVRADMAG